VVRACDLSLVRVQMEIHEIEERKNLHINKLISNHEKAYLEIKEYYYDITKDNLDLIKSLNVCSMRLFSSSFLESNLLPRTRLLIFACVGWNLVALAPITEIRRYLRVGVLVAGRVCRSQGPGAAHGQEDR
jgi:hypothetical protein